MREEYKTRATCVLNISEALRTGLAQTLWIQVKMEEFQKAAPHVSKTMAKGEARQEDEEREQIPQPWLWLPTKWSCFHTEWIPPDGAAWPPICRSQTRSLRILFLKWKPAVVLRWMMTVHEEKTSVNKQQRPTHQRLRVYISSVKRLIMM